ncbi:MAG: type II toxin-antitoxin system PemK/MazF family toxin [Candidatus Acidiferrales bacterium]
MNIELRQWDVVKVRINPEDRDEHPAIILSPNEVTKGRWPKVNVIYGSTKRPGDTVQPGQILLDDADGCEHLTVFDCVFFPVVKKSVVTAKLGAVTPHRRRQLHQTIAGALRLFQ